MAGFLTESPDTRNKRKIDAALKKATSPPKQTATKTKARVKSTSQSKKTNPKIMKTKNNSFSHGFN